MMKKRLVVIVKVLVVVGLVLLLSGCAPNHQLQDILISSEPYGFFNGFLHGFVSIFAFIGNLFDGNYAIYSVDNTGNWYDFGFLIGIGAFGRATYN